VKVGLTGFPGSGKSTVFAALTGLSGDIAERRVQLGTIKVPDERIEHLVKVHSPKKTTYSEVTFMDFPPARDPAKKAVLDAEAVAALRDADALVEVVRGFADLAGAAPRPVEDIDSFDAELVLADLAQVEKRLERLRKEKGNEQEKAVLERINEALNGGQPLRLLGLSPEEKNTVSSFAFLSMRPLLIVLNVGEDAVASPVPDDVAARAAEAGAQAMVLSAKVEAEVAELDDADRGAFLADLGLTETARDRFVRASYGLLDLISFLTAGEDECRAWPIRRGTSARKAAGRIHSDIERGFIRAEAMGFDDFKKLGSESACRDAGRLRLEGKEYVVQDGDIIHFRFNV